MSDYIEAIQKYLKGNPNLGKPALMQLLMKRFPTTLTHEEAWILVSRYFNTSS
jgi:hypothetical protein